ncbi:hypothetical protein GHT09_012057 [Marmota monax]|uniref:Uncharacterized protein n=1 Tax=Marmota monax TaxID=9995 RepID=A0A834UKX0_MARMO|nr:hypothetical protein GHT09_012057 [Marmota monax]
MGGCGDGVELPRARLCGTARAPPVPSVKPVLVTSLPKKLHVKRTNWNLLRCAYMMLTFLFVSYNRGDWVSSRGLWTQRGRGTEGRPGRAGGGVAGRGGPAPHLLLLFASSSDWPRLPKCYCHYCNPEVDNRYGDREGGAAWRSAGSSHRITELWGSPK